MQKIYIGSLPMQGKNIIWKLLDGHPEIVVNHMHVSLGTFLLNNNVIKYLTNRKSIFRKIENKRFNKLSIIYNKGFEESVTIGEFFYIMWLYSGYKNLYETAKNSTIVVNNKELENEYCKFNFNINKFELLIEKKLFRKKKLRLNVEEIIDIMQEIYCLCRKNNNFKTKVFVDCLPNGKESIVAVLNNLKQAKIICMTREPIELCYTSLLRTLPIKERNNIQSYRQYLLLIGAQYRFFYNKIRPYLNFINNNKKNKKIFILNFQQMILNTENAMNIIAKNLNINFRNILLIPSIDGREILNNNNPIVGKINDKAIDKFKSSDLIILKKIFSWNPINSFMIFKTSVYIIILFLIIKYYLKK